MDNKLSTKELVLMGLMIALVWLAGSVIRIPSVGGFVHVGDCMVFLSVVVLGKKKGAVVSALGMRALVDALGRILFVGSIHICNQRSNGIYCRKHT